MRVLVTGAAGFIGSAISKSALERGYEVQGLDCYLPDLYENQTKELRVKDLLKFPNFSFIEQDLRGNLKNLDFSNIELVIHCAAMAGLAQSWSNFRTYQDCNLLGTFNLISQVVNYENIRFMHASTSSVYGKYAIGDELTTISPASPYGITKFAAEQVIANFQTTHGFAATILRLFSVYGPNQRPDMAYSKFIAAMYAGKELEILGDGKQIRSNTYIDDVVAAFWAASRSEYANHIFNVSGSEPHSLLEFVELASTLLKVDPKVKFSPARQGDQIDTRGDSSLLRKTTGWEQKVSFRQGIEAQISTFLKNQK